MPAFQPRDPVVSFLAQLHCRRYSILIKAMLYMAIHFSCTNHENRRRKSGEKYHYHDFRMAEMALNADLPIGLIIAILLHEAIEDDGWTLEMLISDFGKKIAYTVFAVSKKDKSLFSERTLRAIDHIDVMTLYIPKNWWVAFLKVIDRHDNTMDTAGLSDEDRYRLFYETEVYFLPLFRWACQFIPKKFKAAYRMLISDIESACANFWRELNLKQITI